MNDKKYWFFGSKLNTVLLLVLIILMVIAIKIMLRNEAVYFPSMAPSPAVQTGPTNNSTAAAPAVLGNKDDLVSFSIAPGASVSGKVTFTGSLKNNYFFEGNIPVHVLDSHKMHVLETHGTATTDWMTTGPVSFSATVDFTNLPKGPGYIELHNDNPSGDETKEKTIDIPIVIK